MPEVYLKFACSLDGYLNDTSPNRLILSGKEDDAAVQSLRAEMDAILIGAETAREDKARLTLRDDVLKKERLEKKRPAEPKRIILTRSGKLSPELPIFKEGSGEVIIISSKKLDQFTYPNCKIIYLPLSDLKIKTILEALAAEGIRKLLVEGGADILSQFINENAFDYLRISVAPKFLGPIGKVKLAFPSGKTNLLNLKTLGNNVILNYRPVT